MSEPKFKSKVLRYGAIAVTSVAAIALTSGIILSQNSSLQSQSQLAATPQSSSPTTQPSPQPANNPAQADQLAITNADLLAQRPDPQERENRENLERDSMPSGRMLKNLNLSPSQLQKLQEIRDRDRDKLRNLSQQVRQANRELRELLGSETSVDSLRSKHNQVQDQQRQLRDLHFERMLAMREVLTPQQRSQLQEILQKNRSHSMREGTRERMKERLDRRMERPRNREELR